MFAIMPPENLDPSLAPDLGLLRVLDAEGIARDMAPAIDETVGPKAYRFMKLMRLLDARMILLQRQGRVGFYGACTGQEATPIGTGLALAEQDWVFPALRESSIMLVRGLALDTYLSQVFGNAGDVLKGRQMPSHMSARSVNQVAWSSNIGTQLPQAVGAAWAAKLRGDNAAVVGFIGDGGTSEADFHSALTFAATYQTPSVIICQNNQFAISVRPDKQTAAPTYAVKGRSYGIPSLRVDGNDVLAVYFAVREALERARGGGGPTFIEALTYRIGAHSTSDDPSRYRTQEEVDAWLARDPVKLLRQHLVGRNIVDDDYDQSLEDELNTLIATAVRTAEAHPAPARETIFEDVYQQLPWNLREQRETMQSMPIAPTHGGSK